MEAREATAAITKFLGDATSMRTNDYAMRKLLSPLFHSVATVTDNYFNSNMDHNLYYFVTLDQKTNKLDLVANSKLPEPIPQFYARLNKHEGAFGHLYNSSVIENLLKGSAKVERLLVTVADPLFQGDEEIKKEYLRRCIPSLKGHIQVMHPSISERRTLSIKNIVSISDYEQLVYGLPQWILEVIASIAELYPASEFPRVAYMLFETLNVNTSSSILLDMFEREILLLCKHTVPTDRFDAIVSDCKLGRPFTAENKNAIYKGIREMWADKTLAAAAQILPSVTASLVIHPCFYGVVIFDLFLSGVEKEELFNMFYLIIHKAVQEG